MFGSCFRMLAIILVSDFYLIFNKGAHSESLTGCALNALFGQCRCGRSVAGHAQCGRHPLGQQPRDRAAHPHWHCQQRPRLLHRPQRLSGLLGPSRGEIRCACKLTKKAVVGEENLSARTDSVCLGRSGKGGSYWTWFFWFFCCLCLFSVSGLLELDPTP